MEKAFGGVWFKPADCSYSPVRCRGIAGRTIPLGCCRRPRKPPTIIMEVYSVEDHMIMFGKNLMDAGNHRLPLNVWSSIGIFENFSQHATNG